MAAECRVWEAADRIHWVVTNTYWKSIKEANALLVLKTRKNNCVGHGVRGTLITVLEDTVGRRGRRRS